jgi:hypothetical protein
MFQPNTVSPPVSITGILNDVEFEPTKMSPGFTPAWDEPVISSQRSMPVRSKRELEFTYNFLWESRFYYVLLRIRIQKKQIIICWFVWTF